MDTYPVMFQDLIENPNTYLYTIIYNSDDGEAFVDMKIKDHEIVDDISSVPPTAIIEFVGSHRESRVIIERQLIDGNWSDKTQVLIQGRDENPDPIYQYHRASKFIEVYEDTYQQATDVLTDLQATRKSLECTSEIDAGMDNAQKVQDRISRLKGKESLLQDVISEADELAERSKNVVQTVGRTGEAVDTESNPTSSDMYATEVGVVEAIISENSM